MNEQAAQSILIVRAIELSDPAGEILSQEERIQASRKAKPSDMEIAKAGSDDVRTEPTTAAEKEYLIRRAELLCGALSKRYPAINSLQDRLRWRGWYTIILAMITFILGLALNELGPERRISILAFPLLGMLAWNLFIYILLLIEVLRDLLHWSKVSSTMGPLLHAVSWISQPLKTAYSNMTDNPAEKLLLSGLKRFTTEWLKLSAPLYTARARRLLHTCASLLALGAISGMYLRGLGFEYLAGWESTFLSEHSIYRLLSVVLGPASVVTGIPIPGPDHLATIHWSPGHTGENAAPWIHLYAATAAIFIILPRLTLASAAAYREFHWRADFPMPGFDEPYFQRLLSADRGAGQLIRVVFYSYEIGSRTKEILQAFLGDLFGWKVSIDFAPILGYGEEDSFLTSIRQSTWTVPDHLIIIFNMASTPEEDIHGRLLEGLKEQAMEGRIARQLLLILDESVYRKRMNEQGGLRFRIEERRAAWQSLAKAHGIGIAAFDLNDVETERWLGDAKSATWSSPER